MRVSLISLMIILSLILCSCSDSKDNSTSSGHVSGFVNPITPSEGEEWPPQSLRTAFELGGLTQPAGIQSASYWAASYMGSTPSGTLYEDYLGIDFRGATALTEAVIEDYLDRTGFITVHDWETYGWKIGNNILYWLNSNVNIPAGGYIDMERTTGNVLKFGWPQSSDLAIFALDDWGMPQGIHYQYYYIEKGSQSRIFSRFAGASNLTLLLFENYLNSKAVRIESWGNGAYYRLVQGNTVYLYEYWVYLDDGIGGIELRRYETDNPPGQGSGWPPSDRLTTYTLGDWTVPSGLSGISWMSDTYYDRTRLTINFTGATNASADDIYYYLSAHANGWSEYWDNYYEGSFYKYEGSYYYEYRYYFNTYDGGYINLDLYEGYYNNRAIGEGKKRVYPNY